METTPDAKKGIFIGSCNAARSQMAEGFLLALCGEHYEAAIAPASGPSG